MTRQRSDIISGDIMSNHILPSWEDLLSSAARLQSVLPGAVLVGDTASALHAQHRLSHDADHILTDLADHFDEVLSQLESVAGWETHRTKRPVLILGSLDGIETGVRQLIRTEPLETTIVEFRGAQLTIPTVEEMLRIKGVLILKRNAARDYIDFVALADTLEPTLLRSALESFDRLYPQTNGASSLQQLQIQLSHPLPFDLKSTSLAEYRNLDPRFKDWQVIVESCAKCAITIFDLLPGDSVDAANPCVPPLGSRFKI